jgi:type IV fimbrial biogenesis protein FimT
MIELMVAVLVAAILMAMAAPSFQSTINAGRLATAGNELLTGLQLARMEAIRYNARTAVCLSLNAQTATPTCAAANTTTATGWIAFVDANKNGTYEAASDRLLRQATVPPKVLLLGSPSVPDKVRVTFRADGFAHNKAETQLLMGEFDVCMVTRRPLENVRRLIIRTGSRMALDRFNASGACNAPSDPT